MRPSLFAPCSIAVFLEPHAATISKKPRRPLPSQATPAGLTCKDARGHGVGVAHGTPLCAQAHCSFRLPAYSANSHAPPPTPAPKCTLPQNACSACLHPRQPGEAVPCFEGLRLSKLPCCGTWVRPILILQELHHLDLLNPMSKPPRGYRSNDIMEARHQQTVEGNGKVSAATTDKEGMKWHRLRRTMRMSDTLLPSCRPRPTPAKEMAEGEVQAPSS